MKTQGRMAVIVAPKAPFYAWPLLFLEKEPPNCNREDFRTVFLLPERERCRRSP